MTALEPRELIIGVRVPTPTLSSRGTYLKAMARKVWAFALVSVALQLALEGDVIGDARVVLGVSRQSRGAFPQPKQPSVASILLLRSSDRQLSWPYLGSNPLPIIITKLPSLKES
jgi:hypothetical protein